ncbi:MAG TPA: glycoside hydrolase family 3 protein, partial [Elusimicrobiales bacterium]|nr:glycoside hydrolase family 3 protein [Elusimicrobiales bacterium]
MKKILFIFFGVFFAVSIILVDGGYTAMLDKKTISKKVEKLMSEMTISEKIGQMVQVDTNFIQNKNDISKYFIGSMLSGGDSSPSDITAKGWAAFYDSFQQQALKTRLKIPLICGVDALHGHNNVIDATIFPHNIGLGATRNLKLVEEIGQITAMEVSATGIYWTFAPFVSVCRDERWGRCYESFSENPELTAQMGAAVIKGLQGNSLSARDTILACPKHFVGDGGTLNGKDRGNAVLSDKQLREIHLKPFVSAIRAGAKTIIIAFNSVNDKKMSGNKELITDLLKEELGFKGFTLSDWGAINFLSDDYKDAIEKAINAGLDMIMVPDNYKLFIKHLKALVKEGKVSLERINDAVKRILTVKYELGLFDNPFANKNLLVKVGSKQHRAVALQA